jgi:hypothetical protein
MVVLKKKSPIDESFYHYIRLLILIQMVEIEVHILQVQYNPKLKIFIEIYEIVIRYVPSPGNSDSVRLELGTCLIIINENFAVYFSCLK